MTVKRRAAVYWVAGFVVVAGLAVAATFFGLQSLEVASWLAGVASLGAAISTLVLARDGIATASPAAIGTSTVPAPDPVEAPGPVEPPIRVAAPVPVRSSDAGPDDAVEPPPVAHVRIAARAWMSYLERRGVSEGLLRGRPAGEVFPALAPLDEFLARSLPEIDVQVRTAYRPRDVPVDSVDRFWTIMLIDSILHDGGLGLQRWLLRETDIILRQEPAAVPRLTAMWQWLFDNHLRSTAGQPEPGLTRTLISEAINHCGDDHKRLYPNVNFLMEVTRDDPVTLRLIRDALQQHDGLLRERGTNPATLKRVRILLGRLGAVANPGLFDPDLVSFAASAVCPYPFQAMRFPLTFGEVDAILRRPGGASPATPYVLAPEQADGYAFAGMWRELSNLLGSLPRPPERDDWRWDVPTVAEWITLAGCVSQPYPWGLDPPTPLHANLRFTPDSRLSPVGTYVAGRSPDGVYDCCGGVHELVRELPHEQFEDDRRFEGAFRLAGGSYLSPPHGVTGQRFRHLSPRDRGDRPSCVGIRLVAYRERDEATRWDALRAYRVGRQKVPVPGKSP
ncbi:formylglycine-generating enzyme family protein [Plantactinospora endophytica]|uniref:Sulfatase-modifying factor enzyme domain-containing protein n=1 Tax=Plantactinospora endophytica TaxID=673535 RepID=A0ABQ4DT95_9ACTN|nr:hypothetical protein [Plantactinospora endophytica]GIG85655.1 hypothetical protein Pen02_05910 [Plantactinospora endophytica]